MSLQKEVDSIARLSRFERMEIDDYSSQSDHVPQILRNLHYKIIQKYPNTKQYLDMYSQKISFHITHTFNVDGDKMNEYGVSIKMTKSFIEKFSEDYPEGMI